MALTHLAHEAPSSGIVQATSSNVRDEKRALLPSPIETDSNHPDTSMTSSMEGDSLASKSLRIHHFLNPSKREDSSRTPRFPTPDDQPPAVSHEAHPQYLAAETTLSLPPLAALPSSYSKVEEDEAKHSGQPTEAFRHVYQMPMEHMRTPNFHQATDPQIPQGRNWEHFPSQSSSPWSRRESEQLLTPQSMSNTSPRTSISCATPSPDSYAAQKYHMPQYNGFRPANLQELSSPVAPHSGSSPPVYAYPTATSTNPSSQCSVMALDLDDGPVEVAVDMKTGSKQLAERRDRNKEASARFRQKRKERDSKKDHEIQRLKAANMRLEDENKRLQAAKDREISELRMQVQCQQMEIRTWVSIVRNGEGHAPPASLQGQR